MAAATATGTKGIVRQVIGPVLDVEFPAGKLDAGDHALAQAVDDARSGDAALRVAALRETFEECGLWLARGPVDAPALAQADIGFAMGAAGTQIAIEAADVVIMNDDLMRVPETIALSRRTFSILRQNIGLALGIKALFLVLTVAGNATMWMAVFADMGTSLIVIANGLRLLRTPTLGNIRG